jgi:transposase
VAAGHPVVPVHPTAFWAARPRWGASGAKSDAGDSYKLADYLRTDGHRLRRLDRSDPGLHELQALVRLREDHLRARTAASNQLGALLEAYWPGPKAVFYRLASPIALAFLTDYPTPQAAAQLGEARMASFCRRHSYRGGKSPAVLLARLRSAPTAPVGIPAATLAVLIRTQVQLLAEVGPILDRVGSAEQAAAECGAAPVTKASGKTSGVYFRWAANRRARKALTAFAHNSRLASPWARGLDADARARGKRNPHATRIVARAWLRVIWACWQQATPYNPARHTAAQRAATLPT